MEIWNLKGYTNWTEPDAQARATMDWVKANREQYFNNKGPFDDLVVFT